MNNITTTIYTLECYSNGEAADFFRGWEVHGAPGHHYCAEFETLEEAQDDLRRLMEDFALRDGGICDQAFLAAFDKFDDTDRDEARKAAQEAFDKAFDEFIAAGELDDDGNRYGIRAFEVFTISTTGLAYILANNEDPQFMAAVAALERFGIDIEVTDWSEITDDDDPHADAAEKNEDALGAKIENARRFIEVC